MPPNSGLIEEEIPLTQYSICWLNTISLVVTTQKDVFLLQIVNNGASFPLFPPHFDPYVYQL